MWNVLCENSYELLVFLHEFTETREKLYWAKEGDVLFEEFSGHLVGVKRN